MADAPLFTPEQVKADAQNAVVRTTGQAGMGAATVGLSLWVAHQCGWHGTMDALTQLDAVVVASGVWAAITNRSKLQGKA